MPCHIVWLKFRHIAEEAAASIFYPEYADSSCLHGTTGTFQKTVISVNLMYRFISGQIIVR
jgi:hypothetical protein